jgi:hypothetical protein
VRVRCAQQYLEYGRSVHDDHCLSRSRRTA